MNEAALVEALVSVLQLKRVDRAGWKRVGVGNAETVAAHSWGVAWLVMVLLPPELDRGRALTYAVLHDLAEAFVGDITPTDGVTPQAKLELERAAVVALAPALPNGVVLHDAWEAYEAQADAEAVFVRQLDRLDMALQAVAYHREGHDVSAFLDSADRCLQDTGLRALLAAIRVKIAAVQGP